MNHHFILIDSLLIQNLWGSASIIDNIPPSSPPILIASTWAKTIITDLRRNYNGEVFVIDPFLTVFDPISETDKTDINLFYQFLVDDASRCILEGLIAFRCGDVAFLKQSSYQQYFSPTINYCRTDIVFDGGAYIGDTIKAYDDADVFVKEIHSFEPDHDNFSALKIQSDKSLNRVFPVNKGLWSSTDMLMFSSSTEVSYGRKIDEHGTTSIEVTSIDEYVDSNVIIPTIIKLDIEGAEAKALFGAQNTIMRYKPRLAISLYHKNSDLWELPKLIKDIRPDYQFSLGHHRDNWMETILYAH